MFINILLCNAKLTFSQNGKKKGGGWILTKSCVENSSFFFLDGGSGNHNTHA